MNLVASTTRHYYNSGDRHLQSKGCCRGPGSRATGVLAAKLKTGNREPLRRDTSNHSVQHTDKIPILNPTPSF
jgi:hypothetical protein